MSKSRSRKKSPPMVATYEELASYVRAFVEGYLKFLLILGPPGVGKSQVVRRSLSSVSDPSYISGMASAFGLYVHAYEVRDRPLVLDDIDGLHASGTGIQLLKSLCQSDSVKTLSWQTDAARLDREDIPRSFTTSSSVLIIANRWQVSNADGEALLDRAHVISFEPSPLTMHIHAATWFWDQEIFSFVRDHLQFVGQHSLRYYIKAYDLKRAQLDWRKFLLGEFLTGADLEVVRFRANPRFRTEAERVTAFVRAGHGSRATWYNRLRQLSAISLEVPHLNLPRREPPEGWGFAEEPTAPSAPVYRQLQMS